MLKTAHKYLLQGILPACLLLLCTGCARRPARPATTDGTAVALKVEETGKPAQRTVTAIEPEETGETDYERPDIDLPAPLSDRAEQILYRKAYVVSYNQDTRMPNWVAWQLTAGHTAGECRRPGNAFHEDLDVPAPRATNSDYRGSGWSRGHMCPAGDNRWDEKAMYESFLLSNVCPQHTDLNSGVWNQIEMACRTWAKRYGSVYIVCGPILLNREHAVIGEAGIVVPEAFFKVVLCLEGEPKGIGFICRNTDGSHKKDLYVNSIREVERVTGLHFFPHLPEEIARQVKDGEDLEAW